ncbi:hypothetical protein NPIL_457511 [Nephila pilipes]|uniref:Uncharacterized protein n=1 Tax=Nephila pilipes TaxID=299642 RepID=A0A8X6T8B7_NEPPI|nr:hypothetical protein NPIL_457511 [Nephila pilipes]
MSIEFSISMRVKKSTPAKKKVSPPVGAKKNSSLQVTPTPPDTIKVSALAYYESIRRKIRSKPKVIPPQVSSASDRVILKARPPVPPRV